MPRIEPRYPCPVCLGSHMEKARIDGTQSFELDHCRRCGGVWFEPGEVQLLRRESPDAFWTRVSPHPPDARALCHSCHAPIDRNAAECPSCRTRNTIDCPGCERELEPQTYRGVRLDVCRSCRGVWFDHVELEAIWKLGVAAAATRHANPGLLGNVDNSGLLVFDVLMYAPDLVFYGARAAGYAVTGVAEAAASGGLIEGVGEAAGSVFEAIVEIIAGIFS
ncbi:MAG TPA: zf-TFIIB domain-containing protein [Gemmatimonadaceae bacterium]|nr:zf-TFIIB domain-containing protein [Gemmatimonadaceae bacterium]